MKWLFSAHKATRRFLIAKQCNISHPHIGSSSRYFHVSNPIGWSISYQMHSGQLYSTSAALNNKYVDLNIISRGTIKPTSPTPHHLRTFNLSIIDQYMFDLYRLLILFLPNTNNLSVRDVVTKRSQHLKESLSKTLTQFYPLAGKIKNSLHIDCNDEGVYYIEARVDQTLKEFLSQPDDESLRELMPDRPRTAESSIENYIMGIQVNIFLCGGIAISTSVSHKIFDGHTYFLFMKAWATAAKGGLQQAISPSFVASKIFPNNPSIEHVEYSLSSKIMAPKLFGMKRFVFDATSLSLLKALPISNTTSTHGPTRMEATTALLWKGVAKAASKVRPFGPQTPHALISSVNLRKRASPPLPNESFGNVVDFVGTICFPQRGLDLPTLMGGLRESIANISIDHIESMKGEKGRETFNEIFKRSNQMVDEMMANENRMVVVSLLNSGVYNLDFGWGKPIWFYVVNPGMSRSLTLNETMDGGGVEALLTLSTEEMEIFESDIEILSYANVNPSPLRFLKS